MSNRYWFKPKIFGYGASPTTWEGWAVVLGYCAVLVIVTLAVMIASEPGRDAVTVWLAWSAWIVVMAIATGVLVVVSKRRTDGEWRWRWGRRAGSSFRERWTSPHETTDQRN